jgi:hypothetical protein
VPTLITITATCGYHERFAPAGAKKPYLARITGRNKATTFAREFLARSSDFDAAACPALVERRNAVKKGRADDAYVILLAGEDDEVTREEVSREDAMWLAAQMDAGRPLDQCWHAGERVSPAKAERAEAAASIDAAVEACWQIMAALPARECGKVLAALRKRSGPPKSAAAVGLSDDAPAGIVADANQDAGVSEAALGLTPTPVIPEAASA